MPDTDHLSLFTKYRITSADTDMEARLRPGALLNMLIQSAISSADTLGFGFEELSKDKLFWVLSRMTIHIHRPMLWYEEVTVETWPRDVDGLLYFRDFMIRDQNGAVIAAAVSAWLAVDVQSKRPKNLQSVKIDSLISLRDKHALNFPPLKIGAISGDNETLIRTTYFDIDLNRHVTSTRYLDWMIDSVPPDYLPDHYPMSISINYLKETRPGETIMMSSAVSNDVYSFEGRHQSTGQASFRGVIEFCGNRNNQP